MYVGRVEKLLAHYSQIPLCFVNLNGKITRASSKIAEVFKYDGIIGRDIFELTRIRPAELIEAAQNETNLYLDSNDKSFKILSEFIGEGETASIMMSFIDVTSYEVLKDMYNDCLLYTSHPAGDLVALCRDVPSDGAKCKLCCSLSSADA